MRAPDLDGRDEPVVGVAGRHAHVHDGDVGKVGPDLQQQVGRVVRASDDLVAGGFEQRGDSLSQQRVVVRDDDPQPARLVCTRFAEHAVPRILAETERPVEARPGGGGTRTSAGGDPTPSRRRAQWAPPPSAGNLIVMPLTLIEPDTPPKPHLDAARAGDHLDRLYRAARALTGSAHEAEDLVQETYARVLSRPRRVDADKELGYLMIALRHTLIDDRRRRRLRAVALDELPIEPVARTLRGQPEAEFAAREVYDVIGRLPQPDREVLAAVDLAGLSYREAADLLGVPVGTVMSRLSRARAKVGAQCGQW